MFAYIYTRLVILVLKIKLMSSTNDTYHHLLVQTQPKSILKKSPSPRFLDTSINSEKSYYSNPIPSSIYDTEKIDIDKCITNDNQSVTKDNSNISSVKIPLTKLIITSNENLCQYEIDSQMIQNNPPPVDSSSSFTSDDEKQQQKQQRIRIKSKKNYYRPLVAIGTLPSSASSSENDERKAKRSMEESKITLIRSHKHREKDMQLDEFMRKYQQQGGISFPSKQDHDNDQITTKSPINHHHHQ